MTWNNRLSLIFVFSIIIIGTFGFPTYIHRYFSNYGYIHSTSKLTVPAISENSKPSTSTLFVVGDVMLARHVEALSLQNGLNYPYRHLSFINKEPAYFLANFESSIPRVHKKTPNFGMQFSTREELIPVLKEAGITHVGLANNHTYDYGKEEFINTKEVLSRYGILTSGEPNQMASSSTSVISLGGKRIGILFLNCVYTAPNQEELKKVFQDLNDGTDFQILYIHWGEEYILQPNNFQQNLAREFVNLGFDLIIGHHPHVIQSITKIDDVPVFYSLGNFIFDQYFSDDVQNGLMLKLRANKDGLSILPILVTSLNSHGSPQLMDERQVNNYITKLQKYNSEVNLEKIFAEGFYIPWPLASSREMVIMTE